MAGTASVLLDKAPSLTAESTMANVITDAMVAYGRTLTPKSGRYNIAHINGGGVRASIGAVGMFCCVQMQFWIFLEQDKFDDCNQPGNKKFTALVWGVGGNGSATILMAQMYGNLRSDLT